MHLNTVIDDNLFTQARQLTGLRGEREILETVLQAWIGLQRQARPDGVAALRQQKAAYRHKIPPSVITPPDAPPLYTGKPLTIEEMRTAARAAAARRK